MIWVYNLLVFGLLIAVFVYARAGYREMRLRSPAAAPLEDLVPLAVSPNEQPWFAGQRIIGLSAKTLEDGVHLEFYLPPNKRGITSPITQLVSTRLRDEHGTIYLMATATGSTYLVSMGDDTAKRVLRAFHDWKNGREQEPDER